MKFQINKKSKKLTVRMNETYLIWHVISRCEKKSSKRAGWSCRESKLHLIGKYLSGEWFSQCNFSPFCVLFFGRPIAYRRHGIRKGMKRSENVSDRRGNEIRMPRANVSRKNHCPPLTEFVDYHSYPAVIPHLYLIVSSLSLSPPCYLTPTLRNDVKHFSWILLQSCPPVYLPTISTPTHIIILW